MPVIIKKKIAPAPGKAEWTDLPADAILQEEDPNWIKGTSSLYSMASQMKGMTSEGVLIPQKLHESRLKRAVEFVNTLVPAGSSLLDIGCGYGALLEYIPVLGKYTGVEPDPVLYEAAKKKYPKHFFYNTTLEMLDSTEVADYVICLGLATHLKPGLEPLIWFANRLQSHAYKGIIVEFQGSDYKGQFTKHSLWEIGEAFGQRIKKDNMLTDPEDSAITCMIRLV